jgi:hypothetical protein
MKNSPLTLIVGMFLVALAVILTLGKTKTSENKAKTIEVREVVKTKRPRTNQPSSEFVEVVYSTKAFLNKGTPETEQ